MLYGKECGSMYEKLLRKNQWRMKKIICVLLTVAVLLSLIPGSPVHAAINIKWKQVGEGLVSEASTGSTSLFVYDGTPYIAYTEESGGAKAIVKKLVGNNWEVVDGNDSDGYVTDEAVQNFSFYVSEGTPYFAYLTASDNPVRLAVMKYDDENGWERVGTVNVGQSGSLALHVYDGIPCVAFTFQNLIIVMKFQGSATPIVGPPITGSASVLSLNSNIDGSAYLAYQNQTGIVVVRSSGYQWLPAGNPNSTGNASDPSLYVYNKVPYVAYTDLDAGNKCIVKKLNGSNWEIVGGDYISEDTTSDNFLYIDDDGIPYVAYTDHNSMAKVWKLKDDHWVTADNSPSGYASRGRMSGLSLSVDNGVPYVSYTSYGEAMVMKYDSVAPTVTSHPSNQTVMAGQTATFTVTATGDAPLSYQWKKDGTDISGATSSTLTINDVQASDAGSYTCYVSNAAGNVTSNAATLTFNEPGSLVLTAVSGNRHVTLSWNDIPEAVYYSVYQDNSSIGTVSESVYDVIGLTNGITYDFEVKAMDNNAVVIAASGQISATPVTTPGIPTGVTATAGNGQATIRFTAPSDNGGSPITGYVVTSDPGNYTASGAGTSITVTGLTNGTDYTFTVKAINRIGEGEESAPTNTIRPYRTSSGGGSSPSIPASPNLGADILVNGKVENAGTATTTTQGSQTVTTITVDEEKLEKKLESEGNKAVVTIPVNTKADVVIGELNAQMVKNMENKEAVLELKTGTAAYAIPAQQINIDAISEKIGKDVALQDIKIQVSIVKSSEATVKVLQDSAQKDSFSIVAPPVDFSIMGSYGGKTVEVSKFNVFVERTLAIPDGVDPNKVTTGIIMEVDGTVRHVPTRVTVIDGRYYAIINNLTNSTYSVISHPLEFQDVAGHWAKESINDMGSRMVVSGMGNGNFQPDRDITRAEFAAIVVRALGLKPGIGTESFTDVQDSDWYSSYIKTAYEYKIILGYDADNFRPKDSITREQAMTMIARAMKITPLKVELAEGEMQKLLGDFGDGEKPAAYAKDSIASCIKTGVVQGKNGNMLAPKENITRAEVAVIIKRLLQKANLI